MPVHAAARMKPVFLPLLLASSALIAASKLAPQAPVAMPATIQPRPAITNHRSETIDELHLSCRKAWPAGAAAVLPLHRFPVSSDLFHNLIPLLADRYHVIAPDYRGFGNSAMLDRTRFDYTFAHLTGVMDGLLERFGAKSCTMWVMDYGASAGSWMALKHPERTVSTV